MLTGGNGILTNATNANSSNAYRSAEEQVKLAYMSVRTQIMTEKVANSSYNATSTSNPDNVTALAEIVKKDLNTTKTVAKVTEGTAEGFGVTANTTDKTIDIIYKNSKIYAGTIASGTYTAGQEVVYNGTGFELLTTENASNTEHFFVIGDDGNKVKLLAKYCLNQAGTAQVNASAGYSTYGRRFSATNYWKSSFTSSPFNLQSNDMIAVALNNGYDADESHKGYAGAGIPNAVKAARDYGTAKGVEGRLMTYTEATTDAGLSTRSISTSNMTPIQRIICVKWTAEDIGQATTDAPTEGYLYFWLGAAGDTDLVWIVLGDQREVSITHYSNSNDGVRPVLVVSES